jgi:hypothetical protein
MAVEEAADRAGCEARTVLALEQRRRLDQRDVPLALDRSQNHCAEHVDPPRVSVAAAWLGRAYALVAPTAQSAHRGRDRNTEARRSAVP